MAHTDRVSAPADVVTGSDVIRWLTRLADHLDANRDVLDALDEAGGLDEQAGTCAAMAARAAVRATCHATPPDDVAAVLDTAAAAALAHAQGAGGIVIAHLLGCAATVVDTPTLHPVGFGQAIVDAARALPECLIGEASAGGAIPLSADAVVAEVDLSADRLDISTLAQQAWIATQSALIDADDRVVNALGALVVIACAALADSAENSSLAVVHHMLADLAVGIESAGPGPGRLRVDFTVETDGDGAAAVRARVEERGNAGLMTGRADPFGFGTWVVSARTDRPFDIVSPTAERIEVYTPTPLDLVEPDSDSAVLLLERRAGAKQRRPAVIALTSARGIVEELAHAGVHVCLGMNGWLGDLAAVVERLGESVVVIAASTPAGDALARRVRHDLAGTGVEVIQAPTADDLQVLHVASEVAGKVGAHLSSAELAGLQRARILQALEGLHTVDVDDHLPITSIVTDHDRQVRVLLGRHGRQRSQIVAELEAISPHLRVDLIQGDQPGPTVIGVMTR